MSGLLPFWVPDEDIVLFHDRAVATHGGRFGLRNQGLLEQAVFRPKLIQFYEDTNDIARLTACYAASIVQIHPFFDGNKRTGWGAANVFAMFNGWVLQCDTDVAASMMLGIASHQLDEPQLADVMGNHLYHLS